MSIEINDLRIVKLRDYLFDVIAEINENYKQINVDFLSSDINNYSLDKIPTQSVVERWIVGGEIHRDVYSFRSRMSYAEDVINNIQNIGFYELFEKIITQKNNLSELPDIEGIQGIRCLNCGTLNNANTKTAEFDIQIEIEYRGV